VLPHVANEGGRAKRTYAETLETLTSAKCPTRDEIFPAYPTISRKTWLVSTLYQRRYFEKRGIQSRERGTIPPNERRTAHAFDLGPRRDREIEGHGSAAR
jgi:hypothetical protein